MPTITLNLSDEHVDALLAAVREYVYPRPRQGLDELYTAVRNEIDAARKRPKEGVEIENAFHAAQLLRHYRLAELEIEDVNNLFRWFLDHRNYADKLLRDDELAYMYNLQLLGQL